LFDSGAIANRIRRKWCLVMQGTRTRPIILVVEDYADTRQMLKLLLEGLNYDVLPAANGREALSVAANNRIDLILTDFGLPDMTGPTMIRNLRRLPNHSRSVPVVMLTAFDGNQYRELAKQAGVSAFLVKPPDFEFLKRTVDRLIEKHQADLTPSLA
jgi:two-component system chemotaxis response regulator CheY